MGAGHEKKVDALLAEALAGASSPFDQAKLAALGLSFVNGSALSAQSSVGMVPGQTAYVQSFGAYWSYQPTSTLTPDGSTVLAASGGGNWLRGPTAIAEQAIAQALWVVDSQNPAASDENTGLSPSSPLMHVAEIYRRYGSKTPSLAQSTTIQCLSNTNASDPIDFVPTLIGGGAWTLKGTLAQVGAATIGIFTAKNHAVGSKNTITAQGQSGAFWTPFVGATVRDTTSGAQFFIDADLGSATAAISEPVATPLSQIPSLITISNGDSLVIFNPTVIYVKRAAVGAFGNSGGVGLSISQSTIAAESSCYFGNCSFNECVFTAPEVLSEFTSNTFNSCYFTPASAFQGPGNFYAGSCFNRAGSSISDASRIDADAIINQRPHTGSGVVTFGTVYFGQWFSNSGGPQTFVRFATRATAFGAALWGPATIALTSGQQLDVQGTTAVATLLCTGGITLDGAATGFTFNTSTGAFSPGPVALTPTSLDTNGSFQNPRTGTRIFVQ